MSLQILLAEQDARVLAGLELVVRRAGHRATSARDKHSAKKLIADTRPDLVLIDVEFVAGGEFSALAEILAQPCAPSIVLLAALADLETAVAAMRAGASDFLQKPLQREAILAVIERVARRRDLERERDRLREEVSALRSGALIGRSRALRRVVDEIERVAKTPRTTVLVRGESGVGKELVARAIHQRSARKDGPFVALNCAALSEALLEAELFGYEPGAFTGASARGRDGLIRAAEGGSLFLDEIGELAAPLQAKLLRVLQERSYRRVGGTIEHTMDVRIITSTHRDLALEVERGSFREDLFYRLNVLSIAVPRLADRLEDVPLLALHFLEQLAAEFGKRFAGFTPEAIAALESHDWPGNVRELKNAVERAALACDGGAIEAEHLGLDLCTPSARHAKPAGEFLPLGDRSLRSVEEALIRRVLEEARGNRSQAARVLGINRATLYNKLQALRIDA